MSSFEKAVFFVFSIDLFIYVLDFFCLPADIVHTDALKYSTSGNGSAFRMTQGPISQNTKINMKFSEVRMFVMYFKM